MNRRRFIATGATLPLLGGSIAAAQLAKDPHAAWLQRWKVAHDAWMAAEEGTAEDDALAAEEYELGEAIARTPPQTVEGMRAVLELVLSEGRGEFTYPVHELALQNVLQALRAAA
jgi:hypothetical protein